MKGRQGGIVLPLLLVLVLLAGVAWWLRDSWLPGGAGAPITEVSEAAAVQAEEKLRALREEGEPARLSDVELTSLLRYRLGARIPGDLTEPTVRMAGDTLHLSGRVPSDRLPRIAELDRVRMFLPDTAAIEVAGGVQSAAAGRVWLDVRDVRFAGIPIPSRFYPDALERLGRRDEPGLPPTAYPLALPDEIASARVEGGYLILEPAPRAR